MQIKTLLGLNLLFCMLISQTGWAKTTQKGKVMQSEMQKIESFRAKNDDTIMAIPGVVSVASGLDKDGRPCLKIGTSLPVDQVKPHLPGELSDIRVEVEFIGDLQAE